MSAPEAQSAGRRYPGDEPSLLPPRPGMHWGAAVAAVGLAIGALVSASDLGDQAASTAVVTQPAQYPQHPQPQAPPAAATKPASQVVPEGLDIPSIGVHESLIDLGLTSSGALEVPTMAEADHPGWYKYSATPGETGPAVIAGHVDSKTGPAVFFDLNSLDVGDSVKVNRSDGKSAIFEVTKVSSYDKDTFPTDAVYGPVADEELRLITCGGEFQEDLGSYEENLIVFAELRKLVPTST